MNIQALTSFILSLDTHNLDILKRSVDDEYSKRCELTDEREAFIRLRIWHHISPFMKDCPYPYVANEEVHNLFIPLIRDIRQEYGLELKESKALVDAFFVKWKIREPGYFNL